MFLCVCGSQTSKRLKAKSAEQLANVAEALLEEVGGSKKWIQLLSHQAFCTKPRFHLELLGSLSLFFLSVGFFIPNVAAAVMGKKGRRVCCTKEGINVKFLSETLRLS